MPSPGPRERLQPSLFDRLEDDLGPAIDRLRDLARLLARDLEPSAAAKLQTLLADERLPIGGPDAVEYGFLATLEPELRALAHEAIQLERYRRAEQQRVFVISTERLRAACLHDLQSLFNETDGEAGLSEALRAELTTVCASVLNYGLPAITGGVRTPEQINALAQGIARAVERFEPRIRNLRVSRDVRPERAGDDGIQHIGYVIEGELWGYPTDERLRIRTLLDLDLGRMTLLTRPDEAVR